MTITHIDHRGTYVSYGARSSMLLVGRHLWPRLLLPLPSWLRWSLSAAPRERSAIAAARCDSVLAASASATGPMGRSGGPTRIGVDTGHDLRMAETDTARRCEPRCKPAEVRTGRGGDGYTHNGGVQRCKFAPSGVAKATAPVSVGTP
jgi:hypothetical protein